MGASSSKHEDGSGEIDPELLRPRLPPKQNVVNMKKVEKLILKQKLAPF
jgi:hypothetical protein